MRAFVAVSVCVLVRKEIARVQEVLRRADADVKWVAEENLHLTLKFLGEIPDESVDELRGLLTFEAPRWPALALTYAGIGRFPEHGTPRVLWAGVDKPAGLRHLHDKIDRQLTEIGLEPEHRKFRPHVTLARLQGSGLSEVNRFEAEHAGYGSRCFRVDQFVLYSSFLARDGAIYTAEAAYPLASEAALMTGG